MEKSSFNHIDALINKGMVNAWKFIGFYGALETLKHGESWDLLRSLGQQCDFPWLCAGDFN